MPRATGVEVARISVKVSPDTKQFRKKLKEELEDIERTLKGDVEVTAHLNAAQAKADFKRLKSELEKNNKVKVGVQVQQQNSPGGKAGGGNSGAPGWYSEDEQKRAIKLFNKLKGGIADLDGPSFGSGINPAGYAVIIAAVAALTPLIAGLMGAISTAVLALPGLLSAILIPIGALTLGMDGFKKAAETLKQPFDDLKTAMSEKVQQQFTPMFEQLRDLFPTLASSLPKVTQGMADVAKSIVDMVTSPENLTLIDKMIGGIGAAITQSAPGMRDFVQGFLTLTSGFIEGGLPGISKWLNDTGASFSKWVTEFTTKGPDGTSKFDRALGTLGDTLKELGGGFVELIGKSLDFFSDPEKVKAFKAELEGLVNTVLALADGINNLASLFSKVPGLSDGSADSPMDFAPIQIQKIQEAFGSVDWSGIWEGIKSAASTAWQFIQTVWQPVGEFFSAIFTQIGAIAGPVWNVISTVATTAWAVIQAVWQGAVDFMTGVFQSLGEAGRPVWDAIKNAASAAWAVIVAVWSPIGSFFADIFNGAVAIITGVWESIKAAVSAACTAIVAVVKAWGADMIGSIKSIDLTAAGKAIMDGLLGGLKAGFEAVKNFVGGIAAWIKEHKGPISYDKTVLIDNGKSLMEGLGKGLENGFQPVLDQAKDMAGRISSAFNSGGDPTTQLNGFTNKEVNRMEKVLNFESRRLGLEARRLDAMAKANGDAALKAQADELKARKENIDSQKEMMSLAQEYADLQNPEKGKKSDNVFMAAIEELMKIPNAFGGATASAFMQDIGISGDGALGAIGNYAKGMASNYVFNVMDVEGAMQIHQNQVNKQNAGINGR